MLYEVITVFKMARKLLQHTLSGMAEGCMPQIVTQRNGFRQILIEGKATRYRSRNLRHLQRMREARAVVISLGRKKYLCFVFQSPERFAMNNPVAVALKSGAQRAGCHKTLAAFGLRRFRRVRRQTFQFILFTDFAHTRVIYIHT